MSELHQIALSGYYGFGNAGDEAVLAGIKESFTRRGEGRVCLTALSGVPDATTALHGIRAVGRTDMRAVRQTLREADLLISGGGSLLQDTTSLRSLLYYLWVIQLGRRAGTPVMFYAQGIGPLRRPISRVLVRMAASRAAAITVRDPASASLLAEIGVRQPRVEVTGDPAFALTPAPEAAVDALCAAEGLQLGARMVAVALRPWGGEEGQKTAARYARLIEALAARTQAQVVLVPMHFPGDVIFSESVARMLKAPASAPIVRGAYPPDVLIGLMARMEAVVAMRLHALIFAARVCVPPFALSYDPKVASLMETLRMPNATADWKDFDPDDIAARVASALADRASVTASLRDRREELESLALANADRALSICRGER